MSGFNRRFGYYPGQEVITAIEGTVIIDLPPPGSIQGVQSGVVALVGECADASYAVSAAANGDITENIRPVEAYSGQDLLNKAGGFDETIGEFGGDFGNAFCSWRNKRFARFVIVPVNNITPTSGTNKGVRIWRDLPTNKSATNAQPIVPVAGGVVVAGREFKNSSNRVRVAQRIVFTDYPAYANGVDGAVTSAGAAVTQTFNSASGNFVVRDVKEGDILVLGVLSAAGAQGANAATYRVVSRTSATALVVEKMDGSSFDWTTGTALAWRLHVGSTADSSGVAGRTHQLSEAGGYTVPARPLDATVAAASALTPTVVPDAGTANSWDPLSGLAGITAPATALTYSANVHGVNVANNADINARYETAIDATLSDADPSRIINIMVSARKPNSSSGATIAAKLKSHVLTASSRGLTRRAVISPALDMLSTDTAVGSTAPGVGVNRSDRIDYAWPAVQHSVPEAVGYSLACSDGSTTTDGILDDTADMWLAAVESNLPPERNPGQSAEPVRTVLSPVLDFARGTPNLTIVEYQVFRQYGVVGIRFDRVTGPVFQSGITTSLTTGEKNISRRRMADFIQDSIAQAINPFSKLPLNDSLRDTVVGQVGAFLSGLLSENNPAAQRIAGYQIDDTSGNTPESEAAGIFVVIIRVRLTPTADFLVLQSEIGENVALVQEVAAAA